MSYARTSQDVRERDGHGVRNQLRINERTAREHGCILVATYSDNGRSASKERVVRPGFDRLVADLARGHIDSGQQVEGGRLRRGRPAVSPRGGSFVVCTICRGALALGKGGARRARTSTPAEAVVDAASAGRWRTRRWNGWSSPMIEERRSRRGFCGTTGGPGRWGSRRRGRSSRPSSRAASSAPG
ncbi:recombinase family protein [Streptomyces sp. R11]|uniref:Recombinase family protein n=1 Tax=Streptomyces sp. R11 TaxID=3238625 RepID=A0AB39NDA2_9ACTN